MSNVDLVSNFTVLFTLRASLSQTDVLLGNHRGLPIELLRLFKKQFFFLYEIDFCTSYRATFCISLSIYFFVHISL